MDDVKDYPHKFKKYLIVSDEEQQLTKECVMYIKQEILKIKNNDTNNSDSVWMPFHQILSNALEANKGFDVRVTNRIFSELSIVTLTNSHLRPKLIYGNETLIVSSLTDLTEVLTVTQNLKGIPPHKMDFFKRIFLPAYSKKEKPDENKNNGKQEKIVAVTTRELADELKEIDGRIMRTDTIKSVYLNELLNNGLIDELQSEIDNRQKIFYPIIDPTEYNETNTQKITKLSILNNMDNNLQFSKVKPSKNYKEFDENWFKSRNFEAFEISISASRFFIN